MKITIVLLVAMLGGCGSSGDTSDPRGNWISVLSSSCGAGINLNNDGTYGSLVLCQLQPGGFRADGEGGTYAVNGNTLTLTPKQASCPTKDHSPESPTFTVQHGVLTLSEPTGLLTFMRNNSTAPANAVLTWGCWTMGTFTPHPLQPL